MALQNNEDGEMSKVLVMAIAVVLVGFMCAFQADEMSNTITAVGVTHALN